MKTKFLIGFGIFALIALGVLFLIGLLEDDTPPLEPPSPPVKKISVYISGQAKKIAVVELEDNGNLRLADAVNAVGGLTDLADADAVNLAEPLTDGQHIHIPTKEISLQEKSLQTVEKNSSGSLVNINTADLAALCALPGIGESLAARVIAYREERGPFGRPEDIMKVAGIGQGKFAALEGLITAE